MSFSYPAHDSPSPPLPVAAKSRRMRLCGALIRRILIHSACSVLLASGLSASSQEDPRETYGRELSAAPPPQGRPRLNEIMNLYGVATAENDSMPADGIVDERAEKLRRIAAEFSPILRRNTESVPREFLTTLRPSFLEASQSVRVSRPAALQVDYWDHNTFARPVLAHQEVLDFDLLGTIRETALSADHVDVFERLVSRFHPSRAGGEVADDAAPCGDCLKDDGLVLHLFFDFLGTEPKEWIEAYSSFPIPDSKIYAYFFVDERPDESVNLVVQYWMFYPFNDGGNNHEGDWEHLNVRLTAARRTPEDSLKGGMTRTQLEGVLASPPGHRCSNAGHLRRRLLLPQQRHDGRLRERWPA